MSMITHFISSIAEPQFMLARDLMALAIVDGEVTEEEREAISQICHIEGVSERDFLNCLHENNDYNTVVIPKSRREKEDYLKKLILLIGADEYCSPEEAYLFQIIASKMGLTQMDVVGIFIMTATSAYFKGDVGAKVLSTFLKNYIDPVGRTKRQNQEGLRRMYETVAMNTECLEDDEAYCQRLQDNIRKTTTALASNQILINGFKCIGINFLQLLEEEEHKVIKRYTSM